MQEESLRQRQRRKIIYAQRLRKRMTRSESLLWKALRNHALDGLKFRRQAPVEWFVTDFLCVERSLVIEIDGRVHERQKEYDQERDNILMRKHLRILRFTNTQILNDLPSVLRIIKNTCALPLPRGKRSGDGEGVGG